MPSIAQIAQRQEVATLEIEGVDDPLTIAFYPDRISPRIYRQYTQLMLMPALAVGVPTESEIDRMSEQEQQQALAHYSSLLENQVMERIDSIAAILGELLASWNLTEEDGSMVAITKERLSGLGMPFLRLVLTEVFKVTQPGEAKGARPSAGLNGTSGVKHPPLKPSRKVSRRNG